MHPILDNAIVSLADPVGIGTLRWREQVANTVIAQKLLKMRGCKLATLIGKDHLRQ